MATKKTRICRVPVEFNDFIKEYKEEIRKNDGCDLKTSQAIQKMIREFNNQRCKLKDADIIIKKNRVKGLI